MLAQGGKKTMAKKRPALVTFSTPCGYTTFCNYPFIDSPFSGLIDGSPQHASR